jgi:hypothetical protein
MARVDKCRLARAMQEDTHARIEILLLGGAHLDILAKGMVGVLMY